MTFESVVIFLMLGTACDAARIHVIGKAGGGETTQPHQYPWMVRIDAKEVSNGMVYEGQNCGGFLIPVPGGVDKSNIMITAAHCIVEYEFDVRQGVEISVPTKRYLEKDQLSLVAGAHKTVGLEEEGYEVRKVSKMEYHPGWDPQGNDVPFRNDIALIKLDSPISFSANIRPISVPEKGDVLPEGAKCTIAGWGIISGMIGIDAVNPDALQHLNVTVGTDKYCYQKIRAMFEPKAMYCVRPAKEAPSACSGDSGGPMFCKKHWTEAEPFIAYGVASFGMPDCTLGKLPSVYAKIDPFVDWINEKIQDWSSVL